MLTVRTCHTLKVCRLRLVNVCPLANCFPDIGSPTPEITVEHTERQIKERLNHHIIGSPAPQFAVEPSDIEEARLNPDVPEIGSPAPQITVEPTDDQIEEARLNHDVSLGESLSFLPSRLLITRLP
jgi:hypothetical protein